MHKPSRGTRQLRIWLVLLTTFWLLFGIAILASDWSDYDQLAAAAGAIDASLDGVAITISIIAAIALVVLARLTSVARLRAGVVLVTIVLAGYALFGLFLATSAAQASCGVIGYGASRCSDVKSSYETSGWALFVLACVSVLFVLIFVVAVGALKEPEAATTSDAPTTPLPPPPPPPSPESQLVHHLRELASLRDSGILTEEENQAKKKQILDKNPSESDRT
jgi:hypothetical protein